MTDAGVSAAILGCAGPDLSRDEARLFRDAAPWGFILFARNVETPEQVRRLTGALREAVGRDAPVFVDQEGGRVQRLGPPHWRAWAPPLEEAASLSPDRRLRALWLRYRIIAAELQAVGIDACCAPSADIAFPATHPFLRNRCFGGSVESVATAARAAALGLSSGGVLPVVKHIPGHGRGVVDSHLALPRVDAALEVLDGSDFAVFRALADLPVAMTAHVVFEALDPTNPATLSPRVIGAVRDRIGFGGLLLSDDLSMQALAGTLAERARGAIAAGCDIALHCNGKPDEMIAVAGAVGALTPAAARRAAAALDWRRPPDVIDIAALATEFEALQKGPADV